MIITIRRTNDAPRDTRCATCGNWVGAYGRTYIEKGLARYCCACASEALRRAVLDEEHYAWLDELEKRKK